MPCNPSQGSESGPGFITTTKSSNGPRIPSGPGVFDTARQISPAWFSRKRVPSVGIDR